MGWLRYLLPHRKRTGTADTFQTAKSSLSDDFDYSDEDEEQKSSKDIIKREFGLNDSCELGHCRMRTDINQAFSELVGSEMTPITPVFDKPIQIIPAGRRSAKSYLSKEQIRIAERLTTSLKQMQAEVATISTELSKLVTE